MLNIACRHVQISTAVNVASKLKIGCFQSLDLIRNIRFISASIKRLMLAITFLVLSKIGVVAYRLALSNDSDVHHVFHVSLLKRALGLSSQVITLSWTSSPSSQVPQAILNRRQAILNRRMVQRDKHAATQVLVHWTNLTLVEARWEYLYDMTWVAIDLNLEDKVL